MRKVLFSTLLAFQFISDAQNPVQFQVDLTDTVRRVRFDGMGFNTERMFYRILDNNENVPEPVFNDLLEVGDQIYRWPGGATANFYHINKTGYGLSYYEVETIPDPMVCNMYDNPGDYCLNFDTAASKNHIYDLLNYADRYASRKGKPLKVMWIPNLLTFYIHDSLEINKLNGVTSLAQLEALYTGGQISDGFHERLYENIQSFQILSTHPNIDLVGIEYGNELFYHEVVTHMKYNPTNAIPAFLFAALKPEYYNIIMVGVVRLRNLIKFYSSVFHATHPDIKTSAPSSLINHLGKMPNVNQVWNEALRDTVLSVVDAVVHHIYVKIDGPTDDPPAMSAADVAELKELTDSYLHFKLPKADDEFDKFYKLHEKNKEMWVTEFNMDSGWDDGVLYKWMNTFLHAYFNFEFTLSSLDNVNEHSPITKNFQHTFVGVQGDYTYSAYTAENSNGTVNSKKNASFQTFAVLGDFIEKDIYKIDFTATNDAGLPRQDLLLRAYYEAPDTNNPTDTGAILFVFSNKSGIEHTFDLSADLDISFPANERKAFNKAQAKYFRAPQIYSAMGKTFFSTDTTANIFIENITDIDTNATITIPGYAAGYLRLPFRRDNQLTPVIDKHSSLTIYPNPANDILHISTEQMVSPGAVFEVFDMLGKKHTPVFVKVSGTQLQVSVKYLTPGAYFCRLKDKNGTTVGSFVKQ